jgi:hypothetical protein
MAAFISTECQFSQASRTLSEAACRGKKTISGPFVFADLEILFWVGRFVSPSLSTRQEQRLSCRCKTGLWDDEIVKMSQMSLLPSAVKQTCDQRD